MLGEGRARSPAGSKGQRTVKSRKTQLSRPDPAVEAEARPAEEERPPAGEDHPAPSDLPVAPASGMLPPPGGEGLSLAGVAPARAEPNDGTPASAPHAVDSPPARNALSLEERVRRLEDVVATLQLSPDAIQPVGTESTPAPNEQASLADFIASAT